MSIESDLLGAFELHSPGQIRDALAAGASPIDPIEGKRPIDILIEMYTRSGQFADCVRVMLDAGADLDIRLKGLVWGDSMPWETVVFDVTPISYAQCGLYGQFHRREKDIYSNIGYLHRKRYGTELKVQNVPNKYLFP